MAKYDRSESEGRKSSVLASDDLKLSLLGKWKSIWCRRCRSVLCLRRMGHIHRLMSIFRLSKQFDSDMRIDSSFASVDQRWKTSSSSSFFSLTRSIISPLARETSIDLASNYITMTRNILCFFFRCTRRECHVARQNLRWYIARFNETRLGLSKVLISETWSSRCDVLISN